MIRLVMTTALLIGLNAPTALAAHNQFPYEANVAADNVYVRSGPGRKYYHTNKLDRGERVVIHRHDPGGWYMIAPPKTAFSWIRAEYVKPTGKNRGVVTENDVVVWVGSAFGADHDVTQRKMSVNDQVEILGEENLRTRERTIRMYQIAPPRYEYRWILGKYVIPADAVVRRQGDRNPYTIPSHVKRSTDETGPNLTTDEAWDSPQNSAVQTTDKGDYVERKIVHSYNKNAVHQRGPSEEIIAAERDQLKQLDDRFREIIDSETQDWDFTQLEQDYIELQQAVSRPALERQLDLRLAAVERYKKIKAEFDDFIQLTSATDRKEQSLLAIQQQRAANPSAAPTLAGKEQPADQIDDSGADNSENVPTLPPIPIPSHGSGPSLSSNSQAPPVPQPSTGTIQQQTPASPNSRQPVRPQTKPVPRFDGAGIVQRSAAQHQGIPRHVLLAPNGRILAYLQADRGVNLDLHLGQSVGVHGKRWHRPELKSDFIIVRGLSRVRLIP